MLLDLERALVSGFAERSLAAARAGDCNLREFVRARIDVCNLEMALTFAPGPHDVQPGMLFTDGGAALSRAAFIDACVGRSVAETTARLEHALAATPLQSVLRAAAGAPARLEIRALGQALDAQRRAARLDPLGSAPLLLFLLRLQAQSADLRRLAWGAVLGAPAEMLRSELVMPWS